MLRHELKLNTPRLAWISLPCTRISPLTNLTARDEQQWAVFEKRQSRDLKRADEVSEGIVDVLDQEYLDFAWEWPSNASKGWQSRAISRILRRMKRLGRHVCWCKFHGCAYGLNFNGVPIMKHWTVLTSSHALWTSLQKKCPGHPEHAECRGKVAQASSYYPDGMVNAVVKSITNTWHSVEDRAEINLAADVEQYLLEAEEVTVQDGLSKVVREEQPQILALSRNRFPDTPPQGKQLDNIRQMMLRIHRASGHSSFGNLKKLLQMRGAPDWAVELASKMECPDCIESRLPKPRPPASTGELPALMEQIGADAFEYETGLVEEDRPVKMKFLLWRDRASGFAMVHLLQRYVGNWEPKTSDIIQSLSRWLMVQPSPRWIITDPATCFTSQEWLDFLGRSGIGATTVPAEAHWMLGAEERCINILKSTVKRIQKECPDLDPEVCMNLAVHGHNSTIGSSGFSPFQSVRGTGVTDDAQMPAEILPGKSFGGLAKMREMAQLAYQREWAKARMSKLNNAVGRPPAKYVPGDLVMLWRQQSRPGKTVGRWTGPLRMLLQEGKTLWLASGTSLIRATTTQVRKVTRMRTFTGRHYQNVTGESPSIERQQVDISPGDVRVEPASRPQPDSWRIDNGKWLVRIHTNPRLGLFSPAGRTSCPMTEDQLTGKRRTIVRPLVENAPEAVIDDDYKMSDDPMRLLQERWTGETWFEIKPEHSSGQMRQPGRKGKRVREEDPRPADPEMKSPDEEEVKLDVEEIGQQEGQVFPDVPEALPDARDSELTSALRTRGPNTVDGVPDISRQPPPGESQCSVPGCELPGGHDGPHQGSDRRSFSWTPFGGRVNVDESSSSEDSEEMIPNEDRRPILLLEHLR